MYFKVSPDIQASGDWEKFTEKIGGYHQKLDLLIIQLFKNKDRLSSAVPPAQDVKIKVVEVPSHNICFSDIENHSTKIHHGCLKIIPQRFGNTGTITSIRKHSIFRKSFESSLRNSSSGQWYKTFSYHFWPQKKSNFFLKLNKSWNDDWAIFCHFHFQPKISHDNEEMHFHLLWFYCQFFFMCGACFY